jgi:hypothetical protein
LNPASTNAKIATTRSTTGIADWEVGIHQVYQGIRQRGKVSPPRLAQFVSRRFPRSRPIQITLNKISVIQHAPTYRFRQNVLRISSHGYRAKYPSARRKSRESVRRFIPPGVSLSEELMAERKLESRE